VPLTGAEGEPALVDVAEGERLLLVCDADVLVIGVGDALVEVGAGAGWLPTVAVIE
jgi:hypothetical protein